jgi:hypothetical protein
MPAPPAAAEQPAAMEVEGRQAVVIYKPEVEAAG